MTELLELLTAMKQQAERERTALRTLDTRALFDLAAEGEGLSRRLGTAISRLTNADKASEPFKNAQAFAAEIKAMNLANKRIASRSLEVVRALKPHLSVSPADAPAFVSERA